MKKIMYLMEFPIDLPGGGQMSTQTLCEGIMGEDFETIAVCPKLLKAKPADYSFRVIEYSSDENREKNKFLRVFNFIRRIGSFYRIIRREKPDLIHVSMSESLITYGFLRCLGLFKKIPFIYTDRGLCIGFPVRILRSDQLDRFLSGAKRRTSSRSLCRKTSLYEHSSGVRGMRNRSEGK